jgi:hypothetical protein
MNLSAMPLSGVRERIGPASRMRVCTGTKGVEVEAVFVGMLLVEAAEEVAWAGTELDIVIPSFRVLTVDTSTEVKIV